ncbi:MAG: glycosyltransferase [Candidatus Sericytochromatia bacterium]
MSFHVCLLHYDDESALHHSLEALVKLGIAPESITVRALDTEPAALPLAGLKRQSGTWSDDLSEAFTAALADASAWPQLVLLAGESLQPSSFKQLVEAAAAHSAPVMRIAVRTPDTLTLSPRLFQTPETVSGRYYLNTSAASEVLSEAEIEAPVPAFLNRPDFRERSLSRLDAARIDEPEFHAVQGLYFFLQHADQPAQAAFAKASDAPAPGFWRRFAQVMLLKTLWEARKHEEAVETLERFRTADPQIEELPGLWVLRGVMARFFGESELALDCFQQALDQAAHPDFLERNLLVLVPDISWKPLVGMAETELADGLFSQAYLHFREACASLPDNDYLLTGLVKAAFFLRRYDTVAEVLAQPTALRGISAAARTMLDVLLELENGSLPSLDFDALVQEVIQAQAHLPGDPFLVSVMLEFAVALLHHTQHKAARKLLEVLVNALPDQPMLQHNLAYSYFAEGAYADAEVFYRKVLTQHPRFHESRVDLAKVLVMLHRHDEARSELNILLEQRPRYALAQQMLQQIDQMLHADFVPPLLPSAPEEIPSSPYIFVFPLSARWENGIDLALKAFYSEFVNEDGVILACVGEDEAGLIAQAREWAERHFAPELLAPVIVLDEALPLLPGSSAWLLPWRLAPDPDLQRFLAESGYPAIVTGMPVQQPAGLRLPAEIHTETTGEQRRIWRESDLEALQNQMRLATLGELPNAETPEALTTHDALAWDHPAASVTLLAADAPDLKRPGISVCMIVRDEAAVLAHCLDSIHEQVDEIIVVDTGSQDASPELAQGYAKVRWFEKPWTGHFAEARNFALEQATQPWILVLDADESIGPDFVASLQDYLTAPQQPDLYAFPILAVDADGEVNPDHTLSAVPRLFRNTPELRFHGRIHEVVLHSERAKLRYFYLKHLPILHSGYREEVRAAKAKGNRDLPLMRQMIAEAPRAVETQRLYSILGGDLTLQGHYAEAETIFQAGLEVCQDDILLHTQLQRNLLRLLIHQHKYAEALTQSARHSSDDAEVLMYRAQALYLTGAPAQAAEVAQSALLSWEQQALNPDPHSARLPRQRILHDLAQLAEEQEQLNEAIYYFKRYLKLAPDAGNWKIYEQLLQKARAAGIS